MKDFKQIISKTSGFTLIEIIVVLIIIAILATVAIPSLTKYISSAQSTRCTHNLGIVARDYQAQRLYKTDLTLQKYLDDEMYKDIMEKPCPYDGTLSADDNKLICSIHGEVTLNSKSDTNLSGTRTSSVASSVFSGDSWYSADSAFDGNNQSTRWASKDKLYIPVTNTVTLKSLTLINEINIMQYGDRVATYKIEYLKPGTADEWIEFAQGDGLNPGPTAANQPRTETQYTTIKFQTIKTDTLRFTFTQKADGGVSIWDTQFYYR